MTSRARWIALAATLALLAASGAWWWRNDRTTRFLPADTAPFIAQFDAPPAADSPATRAELDELLAMQAMRSPADEAAARADRKTDIAHFYEALGFADNPPSLPRTRALAELVEADVRVYVRAVKSHYRRWRPYEIEPRLHRCIDDVKGDRSYPSGHAAFAWAMAWLLVEVAPDRRAALEARAATFARQRMVCGVHFASDVAAGKRAARLIIDEIRKDPEFRALAAAAADEYRQALALQPERAE